jgi:hypothetical protein
MDASMFRVFNNIPWPRSLGGVNTLLQNHRRWSIDIELQMRTPPTLVAYLLAMVVMVFLTEGAVWSSGNTGEKQMELVTRFSYTAGPDDSPETALALAIYGAKHDAVVMAAGQLSDEGLLDNDAERQMAIFCLVADTMQFRLLEQSIDPANRIYTVEIQGLLSLSDYVKAEIRNESLGKEEMHFSLKEEMEPAVSPAIAPALELSRAYRYINNQHWRMAIIYVDHLEKKYPHWSAPHLAKATAYFGMHEKEQALNDLALACYLGSQEACLKIDALEPLD